MTSMERVLTALGQKEPDRLPFFLLLTLHGAQELDLSIKTYFSNPEYVAKGQIILREKYKDDCFYSFFYAPIEIEAWGGEVIFIENGPPNSGVPFIKKTENIKGLIPPVVKESKCLLKVLETIRLLKNHGGNEVPIIGVVMSPFSLPVMQMGFDKYLELMMENPDLFNHLIKINEHFCIEWANAQLEAGATAICYFDPVSSPTVVPPDTYRKTGMDIAKRTLAQIKGPTATHFASGICLPIIEDVIMTGTPVIGVSMFEDLKILKNASNKRLTLLGNLNGIEMRNWTGKKAEEEVKKAISKGGPGGGFILSDNHGEIPWQVPPSVLTAISEAVHEWGNYPLSWVKGEGKCLIPWQ